MKNIPCEKLLPNDLDVDIQKLGYIRIDKIMSAHETINKIPSKLGYAFAENAYLLGVMHGKRAERQKKSKRTAAEELNRSADSVFKGLENLENQLNSNLKEDDAINFEYLWQDLIVILVSFQKLIEQYSTETIDKKV